MEKQNKELIIKKIDELISIVKSSADYQRYIYLANEMKKNNSIMSLVKDIKKLEQKRVNLEYNKENTDDIDKEIDNKRKELDSFPTYQEYSYLKEDLNNTFQSIKSILEQNIN
ncbi:MAG: YlbF family regulator [Bacilli bacterium]|nr:YlbF family regulator [Bacilli bacterium]